MHFTYYTSMIFWSKTDCTNSVHSGWVRNPVDPRAERRRLLSSVVSTCTGVSQRHCRVEVDWKREQKQHSPLWHLVGLSLSPVHICPAEMSKRPSADQWQRMLTSFRMYRHLHKPINANRIHNHKTKTYGRSNKIVERTADDMVLTLWFKGGSMNDALNVDDYHVTSIPACFL